MRYLIASDIHGALPAAEALMTRFHEEGADRLLLLGDLLYHGPRNPLPEGYAPAEVAKLLNGYADRITAVRGNCDAEVDQWCWTFPPGRLRAGGGRRHYADAHPWASGFVAGCRRASRRVVRALGPHPREGHRAGSGTRIREGRRGRRIRQQRRSSRNLHRAVRAILDHLREPWQHRPPKRRLRQLRRLGQWHRGAALALRLRRAVQSQPLQRVIKLHARSTTTR